MDRSITLTYTDLRGVIAPGELEERCRQAAPILARAVAGDPRYTGFTGWRTVDESAGPDRVAFLQQQARRVRQDADAFVTIGIGGSNQSSRAAIKALRPKDGPAMLWSGNTISAREMADTLARLEVTGAKVTVIDKGALDCTLKARVEAAALRGAGRQGDAVPWGGAVR